MTDSTDPALIAELQETVIGLMQQRNDAIDALRPFAEALHPDKQAIVPYNLVTYANHAAAVIAAHDHAPPVPKETRRD